MKYTRKQQFECRNQQILSIAEQLLLESSDYDLTLSELAQQLNFAKATLYKHFNGKDELLMYVLIAYEKRMLEVNAIDDGAGAGVARMVLQQLFRPKRARMFSHLEEKLSSVRGSQRLFDRLYEIRRERMERVLAIAELYLQEQNSDMNSRDFLAMIWAAGQGGASLLNSTFYQRYLGRRDTLKCAYVHQILLLPRLYPKVARQSVILSSSKSILSYEERLAKSKERRPTRPKLSRPLTPPKIINCK